MSNPPTTDRIAPFWWQALRIRDVILGTLVIMGVTLGFALLLALRYVLLSIFFGILLATALRPLMQRLRAWNVPSPLAASLPVLLLITFVSAFIAVIVPATIEQIGMLMQELPTFYDEVQQVLLNSRFAIVRQFGHNLQPIPTDDMGLYIENGFIFMTTSLPIVGYWGFGIVSTLLFTYYWLRYRERTLNSLLFLLPMAHRPRIETIWLQIEEKIGAFLRGQVLLGLIIGGISLVGYWLIGMPYALLLAVVAGLLEFVPYLGPIMTSVLATTMGLSESVALGLRALAVGLIAQSLEGTFLIPRIMDKAVGVSPVVVLLAVVGFAALFGLGGAFLAIPLAAILQILFRQWLERTEQNHTETTIHGRDHYARLRYHTQDLLQDVRSHLRYKDKEVSNAADDIEEELETMLISLDALLQQTGEESE